MTILDIIITISYVLGQELDSMIFRIPSNSGYSMDGGLGKSIHQFIPHCLNIIEVQVLILKVWHPSLHAGENVTKPDNTIVHEKELPVKVICFDTGKKGKVSQ